MEITIKQKSKIGCIKISQEDVACLLFHCKPTKRCVHYFRKIVFQPALIVTTLLFS